jgi:hypothetical protein
MVGARIGWRAVALGAALAIAVLGVTVGLAALAHVDGDSNWVFAFYGLALGGLAAGGRLAAARRPDAALTHGLLAALLAYVAVVVAAVVLRLVLDRGLDVVALAFNALMAGSAGILGTMVAERWPAS